MVLNCHGKLINISEDILLVTTGEGGLLASSRWGWDPGPVGTGVGVRKESTRDPFSR